MDTQEIPIIVEPLDPLLGQQAQPVGIEERIARLIDKLVLLPSWVKAAIGISLASVIVMFGFRLPWLQASESMDDQIPQISTAASTETTVVELEAFSVHVAGEVNGPGVVEVEPGARVIDALKLVGGITDDADTSALNLAAPLVDGTQVFVPARPTVTARQSLDNEIAEQASLQNASSTAPQVTTNPIYAPVRGEDTQASSTLPQIVDPNTATVAQLQVLNGIGPALAQAIIDERETTTFSTPDDLLGVSGIGEAKLEKFRDDLVFN